MSVDCCVDAANRSSRSSVIARPTPTPTLIASRRVTSPERRIIASPMNGLPWIVAVAAVTDKYADRQHSVMSRAHYLFGWGFVAVCVALLLGANRTASGGASAGAGYGPSDAGGAAAEEIWW